MLSNTSLNSIEEKLTALTIGSNENPSFKEADHSNSFEEYEPEEKDDVTPLGICINFWFLIYVQT